MAVAKRFSDEPTCDFDEFFANWEPRVRVLAVRRGLRNEELEDCVMSIMGDFWKGRYLQRYDPKKGKFTTYVYGLIRFRLSGYLQRLWERSQCEVANDVLLEGAAGTLADPGEEIRQTEIAQALAEVYERLTEYPATRTKNLARLFADVVEQLQTTGKVSYTDIARKYGYSRQAISQQMQDLLATEPMVQLAESLRR